MHIPERRRHVVRYYGAYSSVIRVRQRAGKQPCQLPAPGEDAPPTDPWCRALRRLWAAMIRRISEIDPPVCPRCGHPMRIIAFITEPKVVTKIPRHLESKAVESRGQPPTAGSAAA
jgi:hypothetical protein